MLKRVNTTIMRIEFNKEEVMNKKDFMLKLMKQLFDYVESEHPSIEKDIERAHLTSELLANFICNAVNHFSNKEYPESFSCNIICVTKEILAIAEMVDFREQTEEKKTCQLN